MTAPDILLAPRVAAAENAVVLRQCGKLFCDLQFVERTQEAEIADLRAERGFRVIRKVPLKGEGLGILMVDARRAVGRLVGARLVGENDVSRARQVRAVQPQKRDDRGKWRVSVEEALFV